MNFNIILAIIHSAMAITMIIFVILNIKNIIEEKTSVKNGVIGISICTFAILVNSFMILVNLFKYL